MRRVFRNGLDLLILLPTFGAFSPRSPLHPLLRLPVVLACLGALAACDSLGEPERFYNDDARPPTTAALDVAALRPGQHVAGDVRLALDLDSLAGRVRRVVVWVDDQEAAVLTAPPYAFTLQTDRYGDGPRSLSVHVHADGSDLGLLALAGAPTLALSIPLVFDQRSPTPVALASVRLAEDRRPRVEWTGSADANFYAYLVSRYHVWGGSGPWTGPAEVDTVYDRSATSFLGDPLPAVFGARVEYAVRVWNRREESAPTERRTVEYRTTQADLDVRGATATSADGAVLYAVSGSQLVAVSTATQSVLRTLPFPEIQGFYGAPYDLHLDPQTGRLYVGTYDFNGPWRVRVVDAATFEVVATYRLPAGAEGFAVRGDRLYAVGAGDDGRRLFVRDAATGAALAESAGGLLETYADVVGVSPDGRSVYVLQGGYSGPHSLIRLDVSSGIRVGARRDLKRLYGSVGDLRSGLVFLPDGRILAASDGSVYALDGTTLQPLGVSSAPASGAYPLTLRLHTDGGRVFISYQRDVPPISGAGDVVELDPDSLQPLRSWQFVQVPSAVALGGADRLYVFVPGSAWVVPL